MLALHYLIMFLMLYLIIFHLLNIAKKRKTWLLNLVIIAVMLIVEFFMSSYGLHGFLLSPRYELVYTTIASSVVLYSIGSFKNLLVVAFSQLLISLIATLGAGALFAFLGRYLGYLLMSPWHSFLGIVSGFMLFMCLYPIAKFMKISKSSLGLKGVILMSFGMLSYGYYVVSYFTIGYYNSDSVLGDIISVFTLIGGTVMIIGTMAFVLKDNQLKESRQREKMQEQNYKLQQKHYLTLYEKEENTKKFRHDINKQLVICRQLLRENKNAQLEEYLNAILGKVHSIDESVKIKTGSDFVDANLNELLANPDYANVKFNRNWNIPSSLAMEAMDITSLFMNLMTNAFEATIQSPEQYVYVSIKACHNFLYILIENSHNGNLKFANARIETTKSNKEDHGYGSLIIDDIVSKYKGNIELKPEAEKFSVEITFGSNIYTK